jgi:hypothetical protein
MKCCRDHRRASGLYVGDDSLLATNGVTPSDLNLTALQHKDTSEEPWGWQKILSSIWNLSILCLISKINTQLFNVQ